MTRKYDTKYITLLSLTKINVQNYRFLLNGFAGGGFNCAFFNIRYPKLHQNHLVTNYVKVLQNLNLDTLSYTQTYSRAHADTDISDFLKY